MELNVISKFKTEIGNDIKFLFDFLWNNHRVKRVSNAENQEFVERVKKVRETTLDLDLYASLLPSELEVEQEICESLKNDVATFTRLCLEVANDPSSFERLEEEITSNYNLLLNNIPRKRKERKKSINAKSNSDDRQLIDQIPDIIYKNKSAPNPLEGSSIGREANTKVLSPKNHVNFLKLCTIGVRSKSLTDCTLSPLKEKRKFSDDTEVKKAPSNLSKFPAPSSLPTSSNMIILQSLKNKQLNPQKSPLDASNSGSNGSNNSQEKSVSVVSNENAQNNTDSNSTAKTEQFTKLSFMALQHMKNLTEMALSSLYVEAVNSSAFLELAKETFHFTTLCTKFLIEHSMLSEANEINQKMSTLVGFCKDLYKNRISDELEVSKRKKVLEYHRAEVAQSFKKAIHSFEERCAKQTININNSTNSSLESSLPSSKEHRPKKKDKSKHSQKISTQPLRDNLVPNSSGPNSSAYEVNQISSGGSLRMKEIDDDDDIFAENTEPQTVDESIFSSLRFKTPRHIFHQAPQVSQSPRQTVKSPRVELQGNNNSNLKTPTTSLPPVKPDMKVPIQRNQTILAKELANLGASPSVNASQAPKSTNSPAPNTSNSMITNQPQNLPKSIQNEDTMKYESPQVNDKQPAVKPNVTPISNYNHSINNSNSNHSNSINSNNSRNQPHQIIDETNNNNQSNYNNYVNQKQQNIYQQQQQTQPTRPIAKLPSPDRYDDLPSYSNSFQSGNPIMNNQNNNHRILLENPSNNMYNNQLINNRMLNTYNNAFQSGNPIMMMQHSNMSSFPSGNPMMPNYMSGNPMMNTFTGFPSGNPLMANHYNPMNTFSGFPSGNPLMMGGYPSGNPYQTMGRADGQFLSGNPIRYNNTSSDDYMRSMNRPPLQYLAPPQPLPYLQPPDPIPNFNNSISRNDFEPDSLEAFLLEDSINTTNQQLDNSFQELFVSEKIFSQNLYALITRMVKKLRENANSRSPVISNEEINLFFPQIEDLYLLSKHLLNEFTARAKLPPARRRVGELFIKLAPQLKVYADYVRNYDKSCLTFTKISESRHGFLAFMTECIRNTGIPLDFQGYLAMPVQRLARYELLLHNILSSTHPSDADYQNLSRVVNFIQLLRK